MIKLEDLEKNFVAVIPADGEKIIDIFEGADEFKNQPNCKVVSLHECIDFAKANKDYLIFLPKSYTISNYEPLKQFFIENNLLELTNLID